MAKKASGRTRPNPWSPSHCSAAARNRRRKARQLPPQKPPVTGRLLSLWRPETAAGPSSATPSSPTRPAYPPEARRQDQPHRQPAAHGHTIVGAQALAPSGWAKANGSSIMIRGLDIPRGRLATLWPLQRTNQARAFDADAEAGSHVAQNEGQEEEVEGLRACRAPRRRSRLGCAARLRQAAERYGRNHWPPDSDRTYGERYPPRRWNHIGEPGPRRRVQRRQTRPGRRAKVARPEDPAEESNA